MSASRSASARLLASSASVVAMFAAAPSVAHAQEAEANEIDTIIVTAQRRAENLQAVPVAITALSADVLANNNATSLNEVQDLVPNMHFGETGFGEAAIIVNIRGQGTFGGRNPSVGVYIDEVPLPQVGPFAPGAFVGGKGLFFDVENVQVVKGPQGTLFGRNTTGGAVLVQTRRPGDTFGGNIQVGYGNYNNVEVEAGVDIPLVPGKLAARAAVFVQKRDGYVNIVSTPGKPNGTDAHDVDARNMRLTLSWEPSDGVKNDLVIGSFRNHGAGNQLLINKLLPGSFVPFVIPQVTDVIAQQQALGIRTAVAQSLNPTFNTDVFTVANLTEIELSDNVTLRNIFGFNRQKLFYARSYDGTGLTLFQRYNVGKTNWHEQFTEELQLQGKALDERLKWTAGVFYYNLPTGGYDITETVAFNRLFGPASRIATDYSEESLAFYGQASYDLSKQLRLTAGLRYTIDKARGLQRNLNAQSQCVNPTAPFDANCELDLNNTWKVPTWNIGLDFKPSDDLLLYAAVRRGFRSGGYNLITITDPDKLAYQEELITSFELGFKADWRLGNVPIRTNAAVFHDEFKDAQVTLNLGTQGNLLLGVTNAADAEFKGAELEITIQPAPNFEITASGSYLDVKYKNFLTGATQAQINSVVQNEKYGRPKYSFSLGGSYTVPLGDAGELALYANYAWVDEQFTNKFNPDTRFIPYGLLNLNATWRNVMGSPLDFTAYVTNATNKVYRNYVIAEASLGYASYGYGEPRMFGVRLNYRFGSEAE